MNTEKEANRLISFLLAVTSSSAISAQLVEELFLTCTCIEGNCGEQIKVTESFHVCASLKRILRLEDLEIRGQTSRRK